MSYWRSPRGGSYYRADTKDAEQSARWLGLVPTSAPDVPPGAIWSSAGTGFFRLDIPGGDA